MLDWLNRKTYLVLGLFFLGSTVVLANDHSEPYNQPTAKLSSQLELGVGSDSNVTIDEIDNNSSVRGSLWTFSADLNYKTKLKPTTEIKVGLGHSQDRYDNFNEFDLETNIATADLSHDFEKLTGGAALRYISADLDSQHFLTLSQASLYASAFLTDTLFLRTDYVYSNKKFDTLSDRDATQHSLGVDLYLFLHGSRQYLVVGYKYEDEDAALAQFDRKAHNLKLRYRHSFSIFKQPIIAQLKASYRIRDYEAITPSIDVIRDDTRFRIGADLKLPLSDSLFLALEYAYSDFKSNLPAADYNQNLVALKIGWQFER